MNVSKKRYIFVGNNTKVLNILKNIKYDNNDIFVFFNQFGSFRCGTVMNEIIKNKNIIKYYFLRTHSTGVHFRGNINLLKNFNKIFVVSHSSSVADCFFKEINNHFNYELVMPTKIKQLIPLFYETINNKEKYKINFVPTTGLCAFFVLNNTVINNTLLLGFTGDNFCGCHSKQLEQNIWKQIISDNDQVKKIDF